MSALHALATERRSPGPMRWRRRTWVLTGALLASVCLFYAGEVQAQTTADPRRHRLEGPVTVVDGDTLAFADRTVRLWGVDAPAAQQICQLDGKPWACGDAARAALAGYVTNRRVRCDLVDEGPSARCSVGHDELNGWVVREGWALEAPASDGPRRYVHLQNDAAFARRGLWQGQFVEPWAWRVDEPAPP
jgi:endonuclease YncB( thermonuclease family)